MRHISVLAAFLVCTTALAPGVFARRAVKPRVKPRVAPVDKGLTAEVKPPQGEIIRLALSEAGVLTLRQGRRPARKLTLGTTPPPGGRLTGKVVLVSQFGKRYPVLRLAVRGRAVLEVAVWLRGARPLLIWAGTTGSQGVDKEWSRHLQVTPKYVRLYQRTQGLWRCDGVRPEMLPQGYHFQSRRLLPVLLPPPAQKGLIKLTAQLQAPAGVGSQPLAPFRFSSASSELGCGGQASRVSPPSELHDGRPQTAWVQGWGGVGRGEYVTGTGSVAYRVRAVRIIPGHGGSDALWKAHNRLKKILLLFGPKHRYEVSFPQDPAGAGRAAGTPYWVVFPTPVRSKCLTAVLDEVYPGAPGQARPSTAVSEITVFTNLDYGDAIQTVLRDAGKGTLERLEATRIFLRMGRAVLPKLRAAFANAPTQVEREVILRVLARTDPAGSLRVLAVGLREAQGMLRRQILGALARTGDSAVPALGKLLSGRLPGGLERMIVETLARIGTTRAVRELLSRLQVGRPHRRGTILGALSVAVPWKVARDPVWAAVKQQGLPEAVRADLVKLVGLLVTRHRALRADAMTLAAHLMASDDRFAVRYRVVGLMRRLADPSFIKPLTAIYRGAGDAILRGEAVIALGAIRDKGARQIVLSALSDKSARVRREALAAWASGPVDGTHGQVVALATRDHWPMVREAAAIALSVGCRGGAALLTLAKQRTDWRYRRVRRLGLTAAFRCRVKGLRPLLRTILTSDQEWVPLRALSTRLLGLLRDRGELRYMREFLKLLAVRVHSPRSRNEGLAADLAVALGRIGDTQAVPILLQAAARKRLPQLRAAALEALGYFCTPGAKPVVLQGLESASRLVNGAAKRTQRRCKW
ncbi:MAG: HEAT repeat domain-containing protein [bacterium]